MKVLVIVANEMRRIFRWRANIFFLLLLPMMLILLLGLAFGSDNARFGITGAAGSARSAGGGSSSGLVQELVDDLEAQPGLEMRSYDDRKGLEEAVESGRVSAGIVLPMNYERLLRSGRQAEIVYIGRPDSLAQNIRFALESEVADQGSMVAAAEIVAREKDVSFSSALEQVRKTDVTDPVQVRLSASGGGGYPEQGRFEQSASTQLLLFVFISSLMGSIWLIDTRQLGVARRMLSTPTSTRSILSGVVLGRLAVALAQALAIVLFSAIVFGVDWGDPLASAAIIISFSLVAVGVGVLLGSIFDSAQQVGPVTTLLGLSMAALGGSMAPLEVFPPLMRKIAHVTPHAWANDAFGILLRRDGGLGDVLLEVGVLLLLALVALSLSTWRLRRVLTS